jgi:hypothetical protein
MGFMLDCGQEYQQAIVGIARLALTLLNMILASISYLPFLADEQGCHFL